MDSKIRILNYPRSSELPTYLPTVTRMIKNSKKKPCHQVKKKKKYSPDWSRERRRKEGLIGCQKSNKTALCAKPCNREAHMHHFHLRNSYSSSSFFSDSPLFFLSPVLYLYVYLGIYMCVCVYTCICSLVKSCHPIIPDHCQLQLGKGSGISR